MRQLWACEAASALSWATRLLGYADEAALIADAATLDPARQQRAPLFLPYLGGERSPHNNPQAQASWTGLSHEHQRADLAYAVAEGVGFGLRDGLQSIARVLPTAPKRSKPRLPAPARQRTRPPRKAPPWPRGWC